jgi:hypothetical protein
MNLIEMRTYDPQIGCVKSRLYTGVVLDSNFISLIRAM